MRTIIAGSRTCDNLAYLYHALRKCGWLPSVVISGGAKGADRLGEVWATHANRPLEVYPADWDKHGKKAGYLRNELMAEQAEALIALWDGESRGTKHMIDVARLSGLKVFVYRYPSKPNQT
jgi:hypothetical protein